MASELNTFNFQNSEVRVFLGEDGEPRWVARDVAQILGYKWQANLLNHVPAEWKGVNPINTPGGLQDVLTLTEQGLYFFLNRSDKPSALAFQKWIAGEVIPSIRKTGRYSVNKPASQVDIFIQMAEAFKEQQEQLQKQATKIATIATRLDDFESRNQDMAMAYTQLPLPIEEVPELTTRDHINMAIRGYAITHDHNFQACWSRLYTEFKYRHHIDLPLRAKNEKVSILQMAENLNVINDLYALAMLLFGNDVD